MQKEAENYCYFEGKIRSTSEAKVSVYDIGLLRSYGIYEGITTFNDKPFRLDDHFDRFERSAKALNLTIPLDRATIADVMQELLKKHSYERTNFRMILTGGPAKDGIYFDPTTPTFYILTEEWKPLPKEIYENGARLITAEHLRFMPETKTINYITAVKLQPERQKKGAVEILFTWQGNVLEAATSNFFLVKGDTLVTPKEQVLPGITRKVVLEIARPVFKIEERAIGEEELRVADEAFISSSYKDIVPVVRIGESLIGNGKVGKVTARVMELFADYARRY